MEKIKLLRKKVAPNNSSSPLLMSSAYEPMMLTMHHDGEDIYAFSMNIDRVEEIIEWLYDNTTERFTFLGTENIYFESSQDAMAFKLRWT